MSTKKTKRNRTSKLPVVWLSVSMPCDNYAHGQRATRLLLTTRSHSLTLSDSFGEELFDIVESASDQSGCLRRIRDLIMPALERELDRILRHRKDQVRATWSDKEADSRGRSDDRPTPWSVPETYVQTEKPPKPHDV